MLSVIIPNYNDGEACERFVGEVVAALAERPNLPHEIIIVDDGSSDNSVTRLRAISEQTPHVRLVELVRNFGQQAALYVGLTRARGDIVVTIDGDGQYPALTILDLADAIRAGADMASGVRQARRDTRFQRVTSRLGGYLIRDVLGFNIKDFGSVKAFSRPLVDRVVAVQIGQPDVYPAALSWKPRLAEIPFTHRARELGQSKWSFAKRTKLYFDLYLKYADDRFGLVFKLGMMLMLASMGGTLFALGWKILLSHRESVLVILSLGGILFVMGLQFVFWSFSASAMKQIMRGGAIKPADMVRAETETRVAEPRT